jgi:hypothetical protein
MKPAMKKRLAAGFACGSLLAGGIADAHDNAMLDAAKSPHGGQVRMAGPYHLELVAKGNELTVHVTDHSGTKVPTKGAAGTAKVTQGASTVNIALKAERENLMKGSGAFSFASDTQVAVSINFPGKRPELAQFTPMKKPAHGWASTGH